MTECFWCQNVYNKKEHDKCPKCLSNLNTTEITIVTAKDK